MLDELHGKGGKVQGTRAPATAVAIRAASRPSEEVAASPPSEQVAAPLFGSDGETVVAAARNIVEATVRVDTRVLDELMNMVGELVLVRNRLVRLSVANDDEELARTVAMLNAVTADLQASVMKTRMQPIKKVFGRFPRLVRDLARTLGKEVSLQLVGEETALDKNLVDAIADPLVHLVRNAIDHGIETPSERLMAGKSRGGTVVLAAEQEGDHIKLTISDDGKGMDPERLRRTAVDKGLLDPETAERLTRAECFELIFTPGFSTKAAISDLSGRGVGMDVVKTRIGQLSAAISIHSELGAGSRIEIRLPLTLAIMPTLMIRVGGQAFALPLANVVEIFNFDLSQTSVVDGRDIVLLRDRPVPLYYLRRWLQPGSCPPRGGRAHVVIVNVDAQRVGFVVDQLVGQEEVVIKPLGSMLQGTLGLSGATITGDGRIALILDVPAMLRRYA